MSDSESSQKSENGNENSGSKSGSMSSKKKTSLFASIRKSSAEKKETGKKVTESTAKKETAKKETGKKKLLTFYSSDEGTDDEKADEHSTFAKGGKTSSDKKTVKTSGTSVKSKSSNKTAENSSSSRAKDIEEEEQEETPGIRLGPLSSIYSQFVKEDSVNQPKKLIQAFLDFIEKDSSFNLANPGVGVNNRIKNYLEVEFDFTKKDSRGKNKTSTITISVPGTNQFSNIPGAGSSVYSMFFDAVKEKHGKLIGGTENVLKQTSKENKQKAMEGLLKELSEAASKLKSNKDLPVSIDSRYTVKKEDKKEVKKATTTKSSAKTEEKEKKSSSKHFERMEPLSKEKLKKLVSAKLEVKDEDAAIFQDLNSEEYDDIQEFGMYSGSVPARVLRVVDGDTFSILTSRDLNDLQTPNGKGGRICHVLNCNPNTIIVSAHRCRLEGIDTVEKDRIPGLAMKYAMDNFLTKYVKEKKMNVYVSFSGIDHYGRNLIVLFVDGFNIALDVLAELSLYYPGEDGEKYPIFIPYDGKNKSTLSEPFQRYNAKEIKDHEDRAQKLGTLIRQCIGDRIKELKGEQLDEPIEVRYKRKLKEILSGKSSSSKPKSEPKEKPKSEPKEKSKAEPNEEKDENSAKSDKPKRRNSNKLKKKSMFDSDEENNDEDNEKDNNDIDADKGEGEGEGEGEGDEENENNSEEDEEENENNSEEDEEENENNSEEDEDEDEFSSDEDEEDL